MPHLEISDNGIEISNWTENQLRLFFKITEFPEQYYMTKNQWIEFCNPRQPLYIQRRFERIYARRNCPEPEPEKTFKPLPRSILVNLIDKGMKIPGGAWQSIDYHKDKLPPSLDCKLLERVRDPGEPCPDTIRHSLEEYLTRAGPEETDECRQLPDVPETPERPADVARESFNTLWARLLHIKVFDSEILALLEDYKDDMDLEHVTTIINNMTIHTDDEARQKWRQFAQQKIALIKKQNPLLLGLKDELYELLESLELTGN